MNIQNIQRETSSPQQQQQQQQQQQPTSQASQQQSNKMGQFGYSSADGSNNIIQMASIPTMSQRPIGHGNLEPVAVLFM